MDLHLGILIDLYHKNHLIFLREVGLFGDINGDIVIAFLLKKFFGHAFYPGNDIGGELLTLGHSKALTEIFLFARLHAFKAEFRHTGLALKLNYEPDTVADHLLDIDFDLGI